jgi:hypothetical protein
MVRESGKLWAFVTLMEADYHSVEELGSSIWWGSKDTPTEGLGGKSWASMLCGEQKFLAPVE